MTSPTDTATLREARRAYFDANGFGPDGGYGDKWIKFKFGWIPVILPNFASRVRAVKVHDLHHLVTGYGTDLVGEGAISAYEIGGGCGDYVAAWLINLMGMSWGVILAPRVCLRAFARGRRSRSVYHRAVDDELLDRTVADLRAELEIPSADLSPTLQERVGFTAWIAIAWVWSLVVLAIAMAPVLILVWALW